MSTSVRRSNFNREIKRRMQNFSYEVVKNEDGTYTAKVRGQELEADGPSEQDALHELKRHVDEKFRHGELHKDIQQTAL
jgi:hypothetical protein